MATVSIEDFRQDRLVMSVASALSLANAAAIAEGTEPSESLVTISAEESPTRRVWRIQYGPRNYVNRRGGDLIVIVDSDTQTVQQIIRGQ